MMRFCLCRCWFALWILLLSACASPTPHVAGQKGGKLKAFAPVGVTKQAIKGKRYALVVGINTFNDRQFGQLQYAQRDAKAMATALAQFDRVLLLNTPKTTTRASILQALQTLAKLVRSRHDTVVIYFSTHGTLGRKPGQPISRYLVATDTRISLVAQTGLSVRSIIRVMARLPSQKKALILASCHSGQGKSKISNELVKALAKSKGPANLDAVSEASFVLSASSFKEIAREEDRLKHDVYTYFFLEGVRKGDRDQDGAVTISEAHDYARERTYQFTKGAQRPMAVSTILGRDPIVLSGSIKRRPKPVIYSYQSAAKGIEVRLNGRSKGVLPGGIVVPPGRHTLTLVDHQTKDLLYEGAVNLQAGQRVELTHLIEQQPKLSLVVGLGQGGAIQSETRKLFLPRVTDTTFQFSVLRWPFSWSYLSASMRFAFGQGQLNTLGQALKYNYQAWTPSLEVGGILTLGSYLWCRIGVSGQVVWAQRRFDLPQYQDVERFRGFATSAVTALDWQVWGPLQVGAQGQVGLMRAFLGDGFGPHWIAQLGVFAGVLF